MKIEGFFRDVPNFPKEEIVQVNFLMELTFLNGRNKLPGKELFAAVTY